MLSLSKPTSRFLECNGMEWNLTPNILYAPIMEWNAIRPPTFSTLWNLSFRHPTSCLLLTQSSHHGTPHHGTLLLTIGGFFGPTVSPHLVGLSSVGPMVLWSYGPMVLWSYGPMVLWSYGPTVLRSYGKPPYRRSLVLWSYRRKAQR